MEKHNLLIETHYKKNFIRLSKVVARRFANRIEISEEAVQEAYYRALKYFSSFNPEIKSFDHWFSTILNNAVKDLQKEERAGGLKFNVDVDIIDFSVSSYDPSPYESQILYDIIMGEKDREILYYYYILGLKPRDICQIVNGKTIHAVKSSVYRFKKVYMPADINVKEVSNEG